MNEDQHGNTWGLTQEGTNLTLSGTNLTRKGTISRQVCYVHIYDTHNSPAAPWTVENGTVHTKISKGHHESGNKKTAENDPAFCTHQFCQPPSGGWSFFSVQHTWQSTHTHAHTPCVQITGSCNQSSSYTMVWLVYKTLNQRRDKAFCFAKLLCTFKASAYVMQWKKTLY